MTTIATADRGALQRMLQVQPTLPAISNAGTTLQLAEKELLHAGPPILDKSTMAQPILNSAIAAVLFEGWANDIESARQLVLSDAVRLTPAQDKNTAIPLADVLSASMSVLHVQDAAQPTHVAYSSINGGDGPVTRVGVVNDEVVQRLHYIYGPIAQQLDQLLAQRSIALLPIAEQAIVQEDDLHGRTAQASALLFQALSDAQELDTESMQFIQRSAAFFLNVWMAASLCTLLSAEHTASSSSIIRMGSNGVDFGFQIAALPGQWFTSPAQAPFIPDATAEVRERALGAIGDSAVVDALGYGAMLHAYAPQTISRLCLAAEQSGNAIPEQLLTSAPTVYAALPNFKTGLTAQAVVTEQQGPVISLGVLDRHGEKGRLDGGFFFAPIAPFAAALHALNEGI